VVKKRKIKTGSKVGALKSKLLASRGKEAAALLKQYDREAVIGALIKMLSENIVKNAATVYTAAVCLEEEWLVKNVAKEILVKNIGSKILRLKVFNDRGKYYF
jgi:hypothetical protein